MLKSSLMIVSLMHRMLHVWNSGYWYIYVQELQNAPECFTLTNQGQCGKAWVWMTKHLLNVKDRCHLYHGCKFWPIRLLNRCINLMYSLDIHTPTRKMNRTLITWPRYKLVISLGVSSPQPRALGPRCVIHTESSTSWYNLYLITTRQRQVWCICCSLGKLFLKSSWVTKQSSTVIPWQKIKEGIMIMYTWLSDVGVWLRVLN